MKCLALSDDLMFGSQIVQVGRQAGCELTQADSLSAWSEQLRQQPGIRCCVVDLNTRGLELPALVAAVAEILPVNEVRWLAIGPHVHRDKLAAAHQMGWHVMTRGQFHAEGATLLRTWRDTKSPTTLADGTSLANP
ncbi:MAG: hypothetical protein KDA92_04570 [Planctomycetales bacterium]|nr:hypothetical protein [Planctomycetales bacterium]